MRGTRSWGNLEWRILENGFWSQRNLLIGLMGRALVVSSLLEYVSTLSDLITFSGCGEICSHVWSISTIMVDCVLGLSLLMHWKPDVQRKIQIIFFYFDYNKPQKSQTPADVAASLLKQLFYNIKSEFPEIEKAHDSLSTGRPNLKLFISLLESYLRAHSASIYAVFDALDECNESYQRTS